PELSRALGGVNMALSRSGLGQRLLDLIFLRVSQINGCAYCVDMHGRDLRKAGETERRLNAVAVWREAPFFSARERALLGWVEGLTHLPSGPVARWRRRCTSRCASTSANVTSSISRSPPR